MYVLLFVVYYLGGFVLVVYIMFIWSEMVDRVSRCFLVRLLLVVIVIYLVEIFFFVWTVVYNFVSGGVYIREYIDYLMVVVMLGIFVGFFVGKRY